MKELKSYKCTWRIKRKYKLVRHRCNITSNARHT